MIYTEDIHKKIMRMHDPEGNWSGSLMVAGGLTVIIYIILFLTVWGTFKAFPVAIAGALGIVAGGNYQDIYLFLFRKGIIIRKFDPEIRKYILNKKNSQTTKPQAIEKQGSNKTWTNL